MFAVAHTVEHTRECAQVLCAARCVEQVVVDALQLVHNGTNVLNALRKLYAHSLFDDAYQCVAVHHRREVVHTVGQCECLRVGVRFAHLLYTAVNVAEVWVDALHVLAIEHGLQAQYTVG